MTITPWRLTAAHAARGAGLDDEANAWLETPGFRADVDVRRPQHGIRHVELEGQSFPMRRVLAAQLGKQEAALPVADCYSRGDDLIATYAEDGVNSVRHEIYWRLLDDAASSTSLYSRRGLELIVSVQTSLLHSEPQLTIFSELAEGNVWRLAADRASDFLPSDFHEMDLHRANLWECTRENGSGVFVLRPALGDRSYVQMVHPSDFHRTVVTFQDARDANPGVGGAVVRIAHELFPESLEKGVIRRGRVRGWFVPRQQDFLTALECYQQWLLEPPPLTA